MVRERLGTPALVLLMQCHSAVYVNLVMNKNLQRFGASSISSTTT